MRWLHENYIVLDDTFAVAIIVVLVCGVAYVVSGSTGSHADPDKVSLSYMKTVDNGTTIKYYETNASLYKMFIRNNPAAVNVTYDEVVGFISSDRTDQIPYGDADYICIDYAVAVHDHAERLNISAGLVTCDVGGRKHALNVFNTTDRGLAYFDCTGAAAGEPAHDYDKIARIEGVYHVEPLTDISPYYYVNDKNSTITNVRVYW